MCLQQDVPVRVRIRTDGPGTTRRRKLAGQVLDVVRMYFPELGKDFTAEEFETALRVQRDDVLQAPEVKHGGFRVSG